MKLVNTVMLICSLLFTSSILEINDVEILIEEDVDLQSTRKESPSEKNNISVVIEVKGNPEKHKQYIENYLPSIEVVATYSILFNGLALKGPRQKMDKLIDLQFIKGIHPVHTYETLSEKTKSFIPQTKEMIHYPNIIAPFQFNQTAYTGKGIKVAIVDTGMDMTHPDLLANYRGGFDLIDLDDVPMETTIKQGIPTSHGTHVAGIVGANGNVKGVAPHSEMYAYRALGPGGIGTSIQVIAAMEEAVKDEVDVINLSLGNTVNGPDYPTSRAVNEAVKRGVAVVVANGNAGPLHWTVGAPATANKALSVGAYESKGYHPFLYEPNVKKKVPLSPLKVAQAWDLEKDYEITTSFKKEMLRGKIVLMEDGIKNIIDKIMNIDKNGGIAVILYSTSQINKDWMAELAEHKLHIPIAYISEKDANWLINHIKDQSVYFESKYEEKGSSIAKFSSRGPVTENWELKPDIIAPGVNILSTVPGGYDILNGTSMAAPHITGALAVMKEAKPTWSNEKIIGALKTTATPIINSEGEPIEPIVQGVGLGDIAKALQTETILYNPSLSFGKIDQHIGMKKMEITIENTTNKRKGFYFKIPKRKNGMTWKLPIEFQLDANEKKVIPIEIKVNSLQVKEGLHQGWLTLHEKDVIEEKTYHLPYLFINKKADNPKIMGFTFQLNMFQKDKYHYQLYVAEPVKTVQIQLYNPDTLMYEGSLWKWKDLHVGMNEGEILSRKIEQRGYFYGLIVAQLETGEFVNYGTEIVIE